MGGLSTGLRPEWLALRESADAAARSTVLADALRTWLTGLPGAGLIIRDLGCGTGSMGRWLAGRLPGPQHWVLHDRDDDLLDRATIALPTSTRDHQPVSVSAELGDLTRLRSADLAGTSLVVASALLDMLTAAEVEGLVAACVRAGCPVLVTLSVLGRVRLDPVDPLDDEISAAFNDHQRREVGGRRLLGPAAVEVAADAFARGPRRVTLRREASPWRLGSADTALTDEWLRGWVAKAVEQRPELAEPGRLYLKSRLEANAAGELRVVVEHADLLALPEVWE
jgi:hypothetical protein